MYTKDTEDGDEMHYLNKDELRQLFQIAHDRNRMHHLAMCVGLWHGARVSEVVAIKGEDIFNGQLSIRRLKRSLPTVQPIRRDADPLFDESPLIGLAKLNPKDRIFKFSARRCDQFIKRYAELAGINPDKAHFHALKHSTAMLLWDATGNLGQIQNYLGHRAASSTLIYLAEADSRKAQMALAGISI